MFNFERFQTHMYLKKYFLFLIAFNLCLFGYGQISESKTFTLSWNDESHIQISEEESIVLPLVEGNFFDENNIPSSTHIFNVQNNVIVQEYQIKNVKFSPLTAASIKNIPSSQIPNEIKSEFELTKVKNKSLAVLKLMPLVNNNGRIQKITSFTLEYTLIAANLQTGFNKNSAAFATDNSVLAKGTWFKFKIDSTGIFKIDKDLLQRIGISTANLDPRSLRIYGNGGKMLPQLNSDFRYDDLQENAIYVEGEQDGSFDDEDYILFYGQGPDHWEINRTEFELSKHNKNIYSDHAFYFLTADQGIGKRITTRTPIVQSADIQLNNFHDFMFHEFESVNLFANGQQWLGEDFSFDESQNFSFDFVDLDANEPVKINARAVALSSSNTQMNFNVNGQDLMDLNFSLIPKNSLTKASSAENEGSVSLTSDNIDIQVVYNNNGNPSSRAYLDFIEIIGTKNLIARGKQFSFRNIDASNPSVIYEYNIQNAANINQLWDVADPLNSKRIQNESDGNNYVFKKFGGDHEFIILGSDDFLTPEPAEEECRLGVSHRLALPRQGPAHRAPQEGKAKRHGQAGDRGQTRRLRPAQQAGRMDQEGSA